MQNLSLTGRAPYTDTDFCVIVDDLPDAWWFPVKRPVFVHGLGALQLARRHHVAPVCSDSFALVCSERGLVLREVLRDEVAIIVDGCLQWVHGCTGG